MRKKIIIIVVIIIGLGAGVSALWLSGKLNFLPKKHVEQKSGFLEKVDRHLTAEEQQIYLNRLKEGEKQLDELNSRRGVIQAQEFFKAYWYIGAQYYGLGELEKARQFYQKAVDANSNNVNGYTALFTVALEQSDFNGALKFIEKAKDINFVDADVWKKLISLKQEKFNAGFDELDALFKQALEKTGNSADIISAYAIFLETQGKLQEAVAQWQAAVKIHPDNQGYKDELARLRGLLKKK